MILNVQLIFRAFMHFRDFELLIAWSADLPNLPIYRSLLVLFILFIYFCYMYIYIYILYTLYTLYIYIYIYIYNSILNCQFANRQICQICLCTNRCFVLYLCWFFYFQWFSVWFQYDVFNWLLLSSTLVCYFEELICWSAEMPNLHMYKSLFFYDCNIFLILFDVQ